MMRYILASLLLTGCAAHPADENTAIFMQAYPSAVNVHQDTNYIEAHVDGYKVSGIVVDGQWQEKARRPARGKIDAAEVGQVADVGTTALGLSQGFAEANPVGLATLPIKYAVNEYAEDSIYCRDIKPMLSGTGWGAATANLATLATGSLTGIGIVGGVVAGVAAYHYLDSADECEIWLGKPVTKANGERCTLKKAMKLEQP